MRSAPRPLWAKLGLSASANIPIAAIVRFIFIPPLDLILPGPPGLGADISIIVSFFVGVSGPQSFGLAARAMPNESPW
jgi:hypothetical protein